MTPTTVCWKCLGKALPPPTEGLARLALCEVHLLERVRDLMVTPPDTTPRLEIV